MSYKCRSCGNTQNYYGACSSCTSNIHHIDVEPMLENARQISKGCKEMLFGDNNCCGCNKTRRRIYCLVVSAIFAIAAGVVYLVLDVKDAHYAIALGFVSAIFLSASFCPDCALLGRC